MGTSFGAGDLLDYAAPHLGVVVRVGGVDHEDCDARVSLHVEELAAVHLGVDKEVFVIGVYPHQVGHGCAAG